MRFHLIFNEDPLIRSNHRPRLLARYGPVAIPAALLFGVLSTSLGCDKGDKDKPVAAAGAAVGVVDYDRVFADIGWKATIQKDLEATKQNYKFRFDSFTNELNNALKDKRAQIAAAARMTPKDAEDFAKVKDVKELDKFKLSQAQKDEFVQAVANANAYAQRAGQVADQMLRQREQQLGQAHLDALKAPVRRVAENSGASVVMPSSSVSYFATGVDLTNKVVDDLRSAAPTINVPPAQPLDLPKVQIGVPPTTGPATQPSR
jgi:Skp family chaperone for outer membrane proteins